MYALHFGIVPVPINPRHPADADPDPVANFDGYEAAVEHLDEERFILGGHLGGYNGYVSGSWKDWGIDPDVEHDDSLHVLIHVTDVGGPTVERIRQVTADVRAGVTSGRLVDYVVVSTIDDWSFQTHHASTNTEVTYLDALVTPYDPYDDDEICEHGFLSSTCGEEHTS